MTMAAGILILAGRPISLGMWYLNATISAVPVYISLYGKG
jgi:hypothetical protein